MRIFGRLSVSLAAAVVLISANVASAGLITVSPPGGTVVTLDQFAGNGYGYTLGPVNVGGLVGETITFTSTNVSALGQGTYGLNDNGTWGGTKVYAGQDSLFGSMTFTFATGVKSVGGFLNYAFQFGSPVGGNPTIQALDSVGGVLESYDIFTAAPISTPGGFNAGAFRGISRATNDVFALRLTNAYIILDDLTFTRDTVTAVPLPPAALAGLVTLGGLGVMSALRRRRGPTV